MFIILDNSTNAKLSILIEFDVIDWKMNSKYDINSDWWNNEFCE